MLKSTGSKASLKLQALYTSLQTTPLHFISVFCYFPLTCEETLRLPQFRAHSAVQYLSMYAPSAAQSPEHAHSQSPHMTTLTLGFHTCLVGASLLHPRHFFLSPSSHVCLFFKDHAYRCLLELAN